MQGDMTVGRTASEQDSSGSAGIATFDHVWRSEDAAGLRDGLALASSTVASVIAARGDFAALMVDEHSGGTIGVAEVFGEVQGVLEATSERWSLPRDVMTREERWKRTYLDGRYLARADGQWPVKESGELLETLAIGAYALAAAEAAKGQLDTIEAHRHQDDESLGGEEWLAKVFGQVSAVLGCAVVWWDLPRDVYENARENTRRDVAQWWEAQDA